MFPIILISEAVIVKSLIMLKQLGHEDVHTCREVHMCIAMSQVVPILTEI